MNPLVFPRTPRLTDFVLSPCKGEGRFGKVYMAVHRDTGFVCGLKKVRKDIVRPMLEQFIH